MSTTENPLISVVIITYNSSKYVVETLESIKNQTYQNIELIVSDDCSPDNTVEICRKWMEENQKRFVRTKVVTTEKNTGIAGNANRGIRVAKGPWIKGLAGDDKLMPDCIERNVRYITTHPDAQLVFSKVVPFGLTKLIEQSFQQFHFEYFQLEQKYFKYLLLIKNFIPAATAFINHQLFDELGGYDERMPFIEDWPFWMKAACRNIKFHFINEETVCYRMEETSISLGMKNDKFLNSCKLAGKYALRLQWKTNKLLWLYGQSSIYAQSSHWFVRYCACIALALNPLRYNLKFRLDKLR